MDPKEKPAAQCPPAMPSRYPMNDAAPTLLHRRMPADVGLPRELNALFVEAFADPETYGAEPPGGAYFEGMLTKEHVVGLAAGAGEEVAGGLVGHELDKFERARPEL
jgi:aminoglycoside 3-N-acetyltransferase I